MKQPRERGGRAKLLVTCGAALLASAGALSLGLVSARHLMAPPPGRSSVVAEPIGLAEADVPAPLRSGYERRLRWIGVEPRSPSSDFALGSDRDDVFARMPRAALTAWHGHDAAAGAPAPRAEAAHVCAPCKDNCAFSNEACREGERRCDCVIYPEHRWVGHIVERLRRWSAPDGSPLPRINLMRNDSVVGAEFRASADGKGGTIRLGWCFAETICALNGIPRQSPEHEALIIGLIAHEIGHQYDIGGKYSGSFDGIDRTLQKDAGLREELWADVVAGCLLFRAGFEPRDGESLGHLELAFESASHSACKGPTPDDRRRATLLGWHRCARNPTASLPAAVLTGGSGS